MITLGAKYFGFKIFSRVQRQQLIDVGFGVVATGRNEQALSLPGSKGNLTI